MSPLLLVLRRCFSPAGGAERRPTGVPRRAEQYAKCFAGGAHKRIDEREQRAVRKIFAGLKECRTVLDVPSGARRFAASLGGDGRLVIEMDVALEVLRHARERAGQDGINARFAQGDASHLPLADGAVDGVFCNRLLHHILSADERAVFLRELHRVSRRVVVVSFFDFLSFGGVRKFFKKLKGRKPPYQGQPTLQQFTAEVKRCGFRVRAVVATGAVWVTQKYFALEKV